ncbi:MAG TPA: hypothetical protein VEL07_16690 [Planctomycetota bacterium]|nr:hypothetical protein [Planctomycetota bacterium]
MTSRPTMSQIEQRLRADAAATPSRAPADLVQGVIAAVQATPRERREPVSSPRSWWPLIPALAAVLAIAALVMRADPEGATAPVLTAHPPAVAPASRAPLPPVSTIADPIAALMPAPTKPLRDEWQAVNADAAAACRALLACVPSRPRPAN